jgi:hypothetical protein
MSFTADIAAFADQIANDAGVAALVYSLSYGKPLNIRLEFKQRTEINIDQLPLIMITRPQKTTTPESGISGTEEHRVTLYCGFVCEDRQQAQSLFITLDEAIESAIMKNPTLGNRVGYCYPGESANDEGKWHPVYFFVKEIKIVKEVVWI